jgi:hypothetical protein
VATTVELRFDDTEQLEQHWREHFSHGGAWVAGRTLDRDASCELVICAPGGAKLVLLARVVFADATGTGLALEGFGPSVRAQLDELRAATSAAPEEPEEPEAEFAPHDPLPRNVHERLRRLTPVEQHKVALTGEIHERVVLERLYGKAVWEPLLRNPRLSFPEVARIARMGALPRPLIEVIVGNGAWLKSPEVRRALLANPRLAAEHIPRVLRQLPKHELKLVPMQTAYPVAVRECARRIVQGAPID